MQGQGTRDYGCSPFKCDKYDVTCQCMLENIALFHSYLCTIFSPLFLSLAHKHPYTVFSISPSQNQREKHKDTQMEKHSYSLLHEHEHTRSPYSPCGCHQKQPLCPILYKSSSLLLFSVVSVFSFPPAHSSSPLRCLRVIPRHPTSPTPLLPPSS